MRRATARASRATKLIRAQTRWRSAGDASLVAGMLAKDKRAWLEFLRRYEEPIIRWVKASIRRFSDELCMPRQVEKIATSVESFLRRDRMRALRTFDRRRGSLTAWVKRMAEQATLLHLEDLTLVLDSDDDDGDDDFDLV
jgi:hypothetical protein